MAVGVEAVTDIDGRHRQGSRLEFNAPATFVQGIKEIFSLRRRDPEGWAAVLWHAQNRHMFLFCFVQGKNTAGAVAHGFGAVLLQSKSWRTT